jgi:hypothetical protein
MMAERQRIIDDVARQLGRHHYDFSAMSAVAQQTALAQQNLAEIAAGSTSFITETMRADSLHSSLFHATRFLDHRPVWIEMQESIAGLAAGHHVMRWEDIRRLTDRIGLEASTAHQLSRIRDFDRVLRAAMPEPAHVAWSAHLRTAALPTLSFLAQGWTRPLGLMTELGRSELGASVAWLTGHRDEPIVMMAALTPQAETNGGVEVIVEDDVVCALCGGPIVTIAIGKHLKWIGPRRAVRQRLIFPACSTCSKKGLAFLQAALDRLTRAALAIRSIRGGGQGDGRPRGVLRLVRADDEAKRL